MIQTNTKYKECVEKEMMRKIAVTIMLMCIFIIASCSDSNVHIRSEASEDLVSIVANSDKESQKDSPIIIISAEANVLSVNHESLGTMRYEVPYLDYNDYCENIVVFKDLELSEDAANKINAFFKTACEVFFEDLRFLKSVERMRTAYGEDELSSQDGQLFNTVTTEVTLFNNKIMSVMQTHDWMAGGVRDILYYGYVFDVRTGSELEVLDFLDCTQEEFEISLFTFVSEDNRCNMTPDELLSNYHVESSSEYEFFCDNENLYIILDGRAASDGKYYQVVRWSLLDGEPAAMEY